MKGETTIRDASAIAEEAFVLAYPLVLMNRAMAQEPVNALVHGRETPDTLKTSGWLDLAAEPVVLSVPATHGRYYALWLRDAWSSVFASVGARTTGTAPRAFAVLGPGWHGVELPLGLTSIDAPTRAVHVSGCIEAVGETDDEACRRARDGFGLMPLSRWCRDDAPSGSPSLPALDLATPVEQVERMDACSFFSEVERLVRDNPPDLAGRAVLDRLPDVGAGGAAAPELRASLERGVQRGRAAVQAQAGRAPGQSAGCWRIAYELGRDRVDRLRRAGAARSGLRADPVADALLALLDRDADGRRLTGRGRYVLRFAPDAAPPVHGFWSLMTHGIPVGSAHSIGDLHGLTLDRDGSLPIHIQHRPPARRRRSNWLPAPPGGFNVALRLYWPREEALRRLWSPPPVTRIE